MRSRYRSFAKLNLHLQVVGRRRDGYHELRTLFQTIDLHDLLTVEPAARGVELTTAGLELPVASANLASRAAAAYFERWPAGAGVRLHLEKRIPVGGGLGGGSSNAATVLLALRERFGVPAAMAELWPVARALGADVPYFLVGGSALGFGRGDEVVAIPDLAAQELHVAVPPVAVSTAAVFAALPESPEAPLAASLLALAAGWSPPSLDGLELWNDLQPTVLATVPEVDAVYTALLRSGAVGVRLSGSGGCLFARLPAGAQAEIAQRLPAGTGLLATRTLGRQEVAARRTVT